MQTSESGFDFHVLAISSHVYTYTFFHLSPAMTTTPTPVTTPIQADISTIKSMAMFVECENWLHEWQLGLHIPAPSIQ